MSISKRLYYDDAYTIDFPARVVERTLVGGQPAVILDGTYFYPTGGGQPHDLGLIGGMRVMDVVSREADGAVLHVLTGPLHVDEVACHIQWRRRIDFMQHHTGQHILTQAFVKIMGANTVGFHLSPDSATIDLDTQAVTDSAAADVEDLSNQIIYQNRRIIPRMMDPGEAAGVRIRMMPGHLLTDGLRVIDIEGYDMTACGGTHVAHTGEIGIIKILRLDRRGTETRVEFRCGGRALRDYQDKHAVLNQLAADLTCGYQDIDRVVSKLRDELKESQRAAKAAGSLLLDYEAHNLLSAADIHGQVRMVTQVFQDRDVAAVRALASRLAETPGTLVLFGIAGENAHLIMARSADLPMDMNAPLRKALAFLGSERGGGRPDFCQGGGVPADRERVAAALLEARQALIPGEF